MNISKKTKEIVENSDYYNTGKVEGKDIFADITGCSYCDELLNSKDEIKNLQGKVVQMTPEEYYRECGEKIFKKSPEMLKLQRSADEETLDDIADVVENHGNKLFMPYINYAKEGQEGLHRMMYAGRRFGWNTKFPVLVITNIDEQKAINQEKLYRQREFTRDLDDAVDEALRYEYRKSSALDEFVDELDWRIDYEFKYDDNFHKIVDSIKTKISDNEVTITSDWLDSNYNRKVSLDELRLTSDEIQDFDVADLDEFDFDDIESKN